MFVSDGRRQAVASMTSCFPPSESARSACCSRPPHRHANLIVGSSTIRRRAPPSPSCLSSARQSSTSAALRRFATFATTRSGRCTWRMSQNGTHPHFCIQGRLLMMDVCRQALRYIIRNTTLPQRVRAQAQLQLSQMHCYTRFTQIKNRCIMGGKGRGVFSDFRLGRVCLAAIHAGNHRLKTLVPIPNQRARGKSAGCEEGKLVEEAGWNGCILLRDDILALGGVMAGVYNAKMKTHSTSPSLQPDAPAIFALTAHRPLKGQTNAGNSPRRYISLTWQQLPTSTLLPPSTTHAVKIRSVAATATEQADHSS
jgi:ribosomal protein S14